MASDDAALANMAQMLGSYAESAVAARGYSLSPPARDRLRGFVTDGVMRAGLWAKEQPLDAGKVQESIDKLVNELIGQAGLDQQRIRDVARSDGRDYLGLTVDTIDDNMISKATAKLCPGFWPFC